MKKYILTVLFLFFIQNCFAMTKIGNFKPTFYWVALERESNTKKTKPIKDMKGNIITYVTESFYKELVMEGTGRLLDGRIINFAGKVQKPDGNIEIRFLICPPEAPYGYGAIDLAIPLIPFRSIAVDPNVVPLKSKIYIPKVVGMPLPDGSKHDGYFIASDVGAAIINKRIDMFTSYGDQSFVFENYGIVNMKDLDIYLVE